MYIIIIKDNNNIIINRPCDIKYLFFSGLASLISFFSQHH